LIWRPRRTAVKYERQCFVYVFHTTCTPDPSGGLGCGSWTRRETDMFVHGTRNTRKMESPHGYIIATVWRRARPSSVTRFLKKVWQDMLTLRCYRVLHLKRNPNHESWKRSHKGSGTVATLTVYSRMPLLQEPDENFSWVTVFSVTASQCRAVCLTSLPHPVALICREFL
jgi:hypothetical protein